MKQDKNNNEFFEKVKSISQNATKVVVDMASDIAAVSYTHLTLPTT